MAERRKNDRRTQAADLRPPLSLSPAAELIARGRLQGLTGLRLVFAARAMARVPARGRDALFAQRMGLTFAIAESALRQGVAAVRGLVRLRARLGFESVADYVMTIQPLVRLAVARPALRPLARELVVHARVLAEAEPVAEFRSGALLFVRRTTRALRGPDAQSKLKHRRDARHRGLDADER